MNSRRAVAGLAVLAVAAVSWASCGAIFGECGRNADCASGVCERTIDTGNRCVRGVFPGGACSQNLACASVTCDAGTCTCFNLGVGCSDNSQCCSGACLGAASGNFPVCVCTADAQCGPQLCVQGTCRGAPGALCYLAIDCASATCDGGTCR